MVLLNLSLGEDIIIKVVPKECIFLLTLSLNIILFFYIFAVLRKLEFVSCKTLTFSKGKMFESEKDNN